LEPQTLGTLRACPGLSGIALPCLYHKLRRLFFKLNFSFSVRCNFWQEPKVLVYSCGTM